MRKMQRKSAPGLREAAREEDAGPGALNPERRAARLRVLIVLALAAITIFAFSGVIGCRFLSYDDQEYVAGNGRVQAGFTKASIIWALTSFDSANWHPLTWISHILDYRLFGPNPAGHHAVSLILHVLSTVLLFLVLAKMTRSVWKSAFVAALFGVHPLHVESVAWVAERKDVLSGLFWMLTMWAYLRYVERPSLRRYSLVFLSLALGLTAKPMLVTLPVVLLLLDYWPLRRLQAADHRLQKVLEKVPLLGLSLASGVLTFLAQRGSGAVGGLEDYLFRDRVANALVSYPGYIMKMIWPRSLAFFYPFPHGTLPVGVVVISALALMVMTVLTLRLRRSRPYLMVGWLWYAITLLPVIGIVQVGAQAMADRYTYLPLIGIFLMVAWGIPDFLRSMGVWGCGSAGDKKSPALIAISVMVIAGAGVCTRAQVRYWHDDSTLARHALRVTKDNYVAHNVLANALADEKRYDEAIVEHRAAIEAGPGHPPAYVSFGNTLTDMGRFDEAVSQFRFALGLAPKDPVTHNCLGIALAAEGKLDEAVREYDISIGLNPNWPGTYYNLGNALAAAGKFQEAISQYRKALDINPGYAEAKSRLASVMRTKAYFEKITAECRALVKADPGSAAAHYNLGVALEQMGDLSEAASKYAEAIRLKPAYGKAHKNLAVILYRQGKYAEARKEVSLCRRYGISPHPEFIKALHAKMAEPGR